MTTSAASHLPPAFPARAPWGTAGALRAWQQAALTEWFAGRPRDYLAVATPGAGKTAFALQVAARMLAERAVQAVTVVTPTEHLKGQWAQAAARAGIALDPAFRNSQGKTSDDYVGVALTYAQVAAHPMLHRARTQHRKTLVILDEIHHAGDAMTWGDAVREAFEPAPHRLALTGTPFRSDLSRIPFVTYEPAGPGVHRSRADHTYGYADGLRDGVVRPVLFMAYSGQLRWRTRAGDEVSAQLGEELGPSGAAQALRTALDPKGEWIPAVLAAADQRLSEVRRGMPDAGGLVIASDQEQARAYSRQLARISGQPVTTVLSDDPKASRKIEEFAESDRRWLVAVRMVSEGVDIPRLAVGVYATNTLTPLFFAQAVGRLVRARRRGETASVFLPSVAPLLEHAAQMEQQRDHVLGGPVASDGDIFAAEAGLLAEAARQQTEPDLEDAATGFEALDSQAHFDRVVFDGGEFGQHAAVGSLAEQEYLGLPGLLEPDQVATLLRQHQAQQLKASRRPVASPQGGEPVRHRQVGDLRKELNGLVAAWHHRTGQSHGQIHAELRAACEGPVTALAGETELQQRIDTLRRWATSGRR